MLNNCIKTRHVIYKYSAVYKVLDGGYNQSKYETAVSRTQQRTPAVCHFTGRILEGCLVDESGPLPYASFQEFAQKYLIPSLALPKYGRNQVTRYHMFRDTMEDWSVHGLVRQLIEEGSLLGFETTILEGDAR